MRSKQNNGIEAVEFMSSALNPVGKSALHFIHHGVIESAGIIPRTWTSEQCIAKAPTDLLALYRKAYLIFVAGTELSGEEIICHFISANFGNCEFDIEYAEMLIRQCILEPVGNFALVMNGSYSRMLENLSADDIISLF